MLKKLLLLSAAVAVAVHVGAVPVFNAVVTDEAERLCCLTELTNPEEVGETLTLPSTSLIAGKVYTVAAVGKDVIHDLPAVKTINIPATIAEIGECGVNLAGRTYNFYGCPKLEKFYVPSSSVYFVTTSDGLLLSKYSSTLVRCPERIAAGSGAYTLPAEVTSLGPDAFRDVTTISSLTLGPVKFTHDNSCLNTMPWLYEIKTPMTAGTLLYAVNGVLFNHDGELICFPARKMTSSYEVPSGVTRIGDDAFANAIYLSSVTLPSTLEEIGYSAFRKSNLKSVAIPASYTQGGQYAFAECPVLEKITFKGTPASVPAHFATACPRLATVEYQKNLPATISRGAFSNCTSLTSHRFDAFQICDSAFYNTGFTEVVFEPCSMVGRKVNVFEGIRAFADCVRLKRIDMRAIETYSANRYEMAGFFAAGCQALEEVYFPKWMHFNQIAPENGICADFIGCPNLKKIVLGAFDRGQYAVFAYNKNCKPNVFMKLDGIDVGTTSKSPVANIWKGLDGASVTPIFYFESVRPQSFYAMTGASYYCPGASIDNYADAIAKGCYTEEFFRLSAGLSADGTALLTTKEIYPEMVKMKKILVNNAEIPHTAYTTFNTGVPAEFVREIKVVYTVHGEEFTTTYAANHFSWSGIEEVEAAESSVAEYYTLSGMRTDRPESGKVYIVRRGEIVRKELVK